MTAVSSIQILKRLMTASARVRSSDLISSRESKNLLLFLYSLSTPFFSSWFLRRLRAIVIEDALLELPSSSSFCHHVMTFLVRGVLKHNCCSIQFPCTETVFSCLQEQSPHMSLLQSFCRYQSTFLEWNVDVGCSLGFRCRVTIFHRFCDGILILLEKDLRFRTRIIWWG